MIPFFRKLRWRLAQDNQFLKYSRYAVGEILLVVIGILIALQINNWNEARKDKTILKKQLISLMAAFEEDLENLEASLQYDAFRYYSMRWLLDLIDEPMTLEEDLIRSFESRVSYNHPLFKDSIMPLPAQYDREFINLAFSHSGRHRPVILNLKAMKELENTGMYSSFQNKELKNRINTYYSQVEAGLFGLKEKLFFLETNWESSLFEDGILYIDVRDVEDPLEYIQNNPYRVSMLRSLARMAIYRAHHIKRGIEDLEVIMIDLENEIEIIE